MGAMIWGKVKGQLLWEFCMVMKSGIIQYAPDNLGPGLPKSTEGINGQAQSTSIG